MIRLLVDSNILNKDIIELGGEYHHKLLRVLKVRVGDKVELIDGRGTIFETEIYSTSKTTTSLKPINKKFIPKPKTEITLIQAIAKGDRFDFVIQKATELGVSRIAPIITRRTVVKIPKNKEKGKVERWREIARHALEQSGLAWLPEIDEPKSFEDFIRSFKASKLNLFFYEEEKQNSIKEVWPASTPENISILIGPEGGFDPAEAGLATKAGFRSLSLGKTIFRTDTAPLVALSIVQFLTGNLRHPEA